MCSSASPWRINVAVQYSHTANTELAAWNFTAAPHCGQLANFTGDPDPEACV